MRNNHGFTLMELLIVIAIIGILVSVAVVSYSSAQKKGRDSRRHSDLKAIQNAWEQYYADNNGTYPGSCAFSMTPTPGVMSGVYLPGNLPNDPKSGAAPTPYLSKCSDSTYCFCAVLEGESTQKTNCTTTPTPPAAVGLDCVTNLQ